MLSGRFNAMRRMAQQTMRAPARVSMARPFSVLTVGEHHNRDEIISKLDRFHSTVNGVGWGDYWNLVQDGPFWEAEWEYLTVHSEFWKGDDEVGKKIEEINRMLDCLARCEDIRDHINELMELSTRSHGILSTGLMAGDKIDDKSMEENCEMLGKEYDATHEMYPEYKAKIDQSIGHGMALLRQKVKFSWSTKHRFFF